MSHRSSDYQHDCDAVLRQRFWLFWYFTILKWRFPKKDSQQLQTWKLLNLQHKIVTIVSVTHTHTRHCCNVETTHTIRDIRIICSNWNHDCCNRQYGIVVGFQNVAKTAGHHVTPELTRNRNIWFLISIYFWLVTMQIDWTISGYILTDCSNISQWRIQDCVDLLTIQKLMNLIAWCNVDRMGSDRTTF